MDRALDPAVRRRRWIKRILTLVALVAAGGAVLGALPRWLQPSLHRDRIRTAIVERGTLEVTIEATGRVIPAFEKVLSSPVEARVLRVLRRPGEAVEPGDEILELDTSATRLAIEQLAQRLDQQQNQQEQLRLELAETERGLRSRIAGRRLDLDVLRYRVQQQTKLHADGLVAEEQLRSAEVEAQKAEIELAALADSVQHAEQTSRARAAGVELETRFSQKELAEARRQLELATTRADRAGVLTWVVAEEGATVAKGEVIARIADLGSFQVEATLSDVHAARLAEGLPVRILEGSRVRTGLLTRIYPAIENGAVRFRVALDEPSSPGLRTNLRVDVLVVTETRPAVLKLDRGPFAQGGALQQVFVVRGDEAKRTAVRVGLAGHDEYEVLEGLNEGDEVIVSDMADYLHLRAVDIR